MNCRAVPNRLAWRYPACRHGCVATEVALCVPLLILLALATADFGRVAHAYQVVCNAARGGAERGSMQTVTPYSYSAWKERVLQATLHEMSNFPDFDSEQCECLVEWTTDSDGLSQTRVTVSYPFRTVVSWPLIPPTVQLERTVEFRQFR